MAVNIGNAFRDHLLDRLDATFPPGTTLKFYTGSRPALTTDAASGTLLVTLTAPASNWAAASGNSKAKSGTWSGTAVASGNAGWARLESSSRVVDFTVGTSGADINMAAGVNIVSGKNVTLNTLVASV